MKQVTMVCRTDPNKPKFLYARLISEEGLEVSATFDYCVSAAKERSYQITNAQEVLEWLHKNANIKPN